MVIDDNTEFEWSDEKTRSNIKDHHISFEEAVRVFADKFMIGAEGVHTSPLCGEKGYVPLSATSPGQQHTPLLAGYVD